MAVDAPYKNTGRFFVLMERSGEQLKNAQCFYRNRVL